MNPIEIKLKLKNIGFFLKSFEAHSATIDTPIGKLDYCIGVEGQEIWRMNDETVMVDGRTRGSLRDKIIGYDKKKRAPK